MNRKILSSLAALGLGALVLGGCATPAPNAVKDPRLPTEQFRAKVATAPQEVRLAIHADGLSPRQAEALAGLVGAWRNDEGGVIGVQAPSAGADGAAVYRMSEGARAFLVGQGVPPDQIELVGYDPQGETPATLRVGYLRYHVEALKCGEAWPSVTRSISNRPQANFGCAVTANMAAQIANPADLLAPRNLDPADSARRAEVLTKYRKGEVTSSLKDENASGAVSQAVR